MHPLCEIALVIVSKKNKKTLKQKKYVFYCSVAQIHINPEKKTRKNPSYSYAVVVILLSTRAQGHLINSYKHLINYFRIDILLRHQFQSVWPGAI